MKKDFDVIIIGAGVAGMTSALYLKRANVNCCLIEKDAPGGQIVRTGMIENYPGIAKITGVDLATSLFQQVTELGVPYHYGDVLKIEISEDCKKVVTNQEELICNSIILASGRSPKGLGLPNEEKLTGRGISYCATCDGALYRDQEVAIVGGGNSAVEEAIYLAELCSRVTVIHRRDHFTADPYLVEKLLAKKNVTIHFKSQVIAYQEEDGKLSSIKVKEQDQLFEEKVAGLFLFVGHVPNTSFLKGMKLLTRDGYVKVDRQGRTKIPGIYAAGDILKKDAYQIVTAAGEGATAAMTLLHDTKQ